MRSFHHTRKMLSKNPAKIARTRNQAPTTTRIQPPQRFTVGACAVIRATVRSSALATVNAAMKINPTSTMAATTKAVNAAPKPPIVRAYPARPARIGPVQPKPAST